jgi:hypothetical protein
LGGCRGQKERRKEREQIPKKEEENCERQERIIIVE